MNYVTDFTRNNKGNKYRKETSYIGLGVAVDFREAYTSLFSDFVEHNIKRSIRELLNSRLTKYR